MVRSPIRSSLSLSLVMAAVAASACSGATSSDAAPVTATASEGARAPVAPTAHGMAKRVAEALGQVALRSDQRAQIEALAADAEARHGSGIAARQAVADLLAKQVEAGAFDRAAFAPLVDAMVAAHRDNETKDRAAFEALHGLLDASQRAEFVEAMGSHARPHDGEHEARGWKGRDPGQRWADELGFTDEQRAAFKQIMQDAFVGDHAGAGGTHHDGFLHHAARGKALLEAFKGETFSFDNVLPAEDMGARASGMTGHVLDIAEQVLPILTPTQRTVAAQKIRERAEMVPFTPGL